MAGADDFVFLDDVQLEKQSWQTRNRLLISGAVRWIVVPVRNTQLAQTIAETEVLHGTHWREKLARGFDLNYGRHPHHAAAREVFEALLACPSSLLGEMNETIVRFVARRLDLPCRLHRGSDLGQPGVRSERLIALCRHLEALEYLSPRGSQQYLQEDGFERHSPAKLRYQDYAPQPYPQRGTSAFHSHLSIVDLVANVGWSGAREYVRTGATSLPAAASMQPPMDPLQ
ncbi:MAG: WbqC family protein [Steroidobacteraceae bacterium]|nr:WbqC family protein [Steroidobacteraceae bacterium]